MSTENEYTPTTGDVREDFAFPWSPEQIGDRRARVEAFDRWLAARDAGKRAEWEAEQGVKRQFTAAYRARNGNVIALDTPTVVREHAAKTASEFAEEDPEGPDYFVATRILPPWLPVTNTESEGTA